MGLNKRLISTAAAGVVNTENFAPVIYTGNRVDASTTNPQTVGFQPDFVWQKIRTQPYSHILLDSIRGGDNMLRSNDTAQESNGTTNNFGGIDFVSNGVIINSANYAVDNLNKFGDDMVIWCWKAGGAAVSGTGTNAQNITYSANPDAGFSVVKFSTNGSASYTATHGLNQEPDLVITKATSAGANWISYVKQLGVSKYLFLDTTAAAATYSNLWNGMSSTHIGGASAVYGGTNTFVNYCFHSVDGYQKVGTYTASGSWGTSATIDVGFPPRFVLIKSIDNAGNWLMVDSLRGGSNGQDRARLNANSSGAEGADTSVDFSGNTFSITFGSTGNQGTPNVSRYIYLAIA
jgi:hypothetical protein